MKDDLKASLALTLPASHQGGNLRFGQCSGSNVLLLTPNFCIMDMNNITGISCKGVFFLGARLSQSRVHLWVSMSGLCLRDILSGLFCISTH